MKIIKKVIDYIKSNFFYLLFIFILLFISFVKLPYNVQMPGGVINLNNRVKIDDKKVPIKGSFNMSYVSVVQGSIPYIIGGLIIPDWDVEKEEESLLENETIDDANKRNKLFLEQSKNAAVIAALNEAKIGYKKKNSKNNILYIYKEADTSLEVGDNIIECDNVEIKDVRDIVKIIDNKKIGDKINLKVLRNKKKVDTYAKVIEMNKEKKLGIVSLTTFDIDSGIKVSMDTTASESGSSGGLMMSLMIYSGLVDKDYTNGKKVAGTGTIDEDGKVGSIGGIKYKIIGASKEKVDIFFVPSDNYEDALKVMKEKNYKYKLVRVDSLKEAIKYLEGDNNEK